MNVIEFEEPSNYESVASRLEDVLSDMECPIRKEKTLIHHLSKVDVYAFGRFVTQNESKYPNASEVMDLYVAPNISKQEERGKRLKTKHKLGDFIANYHESMDSELVTELQKILSRA
ncbi:TPA: hypothetical protein NGT44_004738 [Vibrio parahaemolyticus]|nr:hypothetical protein [Vibrio parahaemolyticus]